MSVTRKRLRNYNLHTSYELKCFARLLFILAVMLGMICHAYAEPEECEFSIYVYGKDEHNKCGYYLPGTPGVVFSPISFEEKESREGKKLKHLAVYIHIQPHIKDVDLPLKPIPHYMTLAKHPVHIAPAFIDDLKQLSEDNSLLCENNGCNSIPYIDAHELSDEDSPYSFFQVVKSMPSHAAGTRLCYMCVHNMDQEQVSKNIITDFAAKQDWIELIRPYTENNEKLFSCPCGEITASTQHEIMESNHLATCKELLLQCRVCDCRSEQEREQFKSISAFEHHINTEHEEIIQHGLTCSHCGLDSNSLKRLVDHTHPCAHCHEEVPCAKLKQHDEQCIRTCEFLGCTFTGTNSEMKAHKNSLKSVALHMKQLNHKLDELQPPRHSGSHSHGTAFNQATPTPWEIRELEQRLQKMNLDTQPLQSKILMQTGEIGTIQKVQAMQETSGNKYPYQLVINVDQLQNCCRKLQSDIEILQGGSCGSIFIWKFDHLYKRMKDAKDNRVTSHYSAPFRLGKYGYKMCLRVYLNGDGLGEGTHLSVYFCLMRSEHDALLPWPFMQKVTVLIMAQDENFVGRNPTGKAFIPNPESSSFQRPKTEMNLGSGCPTFCPLAYLENNTFVRNSTMYIKCIVSSEGLEGLDYIY